MRSCGWCMRYSMTCLGETTKRLRWCIHIASEAHGQILKIVASMNIVVHKSTNPVIELSTILFLNLFQFFSNERCSHEDFMFKVCIHWNWRLLKFNLIFCFCSPILLNDIFHYIICLVNNDAIFTLNRVNVEEF